MAITFNHNDKLYVSGSNVGIGTDSPTSILHLENAGNTWAKFINTSGTNQRLDVGTNSSSQHFVFGYGAYPVLFGSNGAERMRIDSSGNVGIGTTSPNVPLEIQGADIITTSTTTATSVLRLVRDITDASFPNRKNSAVDFMLSRQQTVNNNLPYTRLDIRLAGTTDSSTPSLDVMSLLHNGNVGIGKTDPSAPLHINGGSTNQVVKIQSNSAPYIRFKEGGTDVGFIQFGTDTYISNQKDGTLNFRTNNTDKMTILSNGNVGIGTTNPTRDLHIVKSNDGGQVRFQIINTSNTADSTSVISIYNGGADGGDPFLHWKIDAQQDWSMGIDNSDSDKLKISKNFGPGTNDYLTVDTSGNVGIGTTSPGNALEINPPQVSFNLSSLPDGNIALSNNSSAANSPTIAGKSENGGQAGLQFITGTPDTNSNADMIFSVRESDNTDFSTTTSIAYNFLRYTTSLLAIKRDGKVGIGTTSPSYKLDVGGGNFFVNGSNRDWGGTGGLGTHIGTGDFDIYKGTPGSGTHRFKVTNAGNVGIGTTSPSEKVEIYGNATYYSAKNTSGNVAARLGTDSSGDGNFELFQSADTNNRKVKLYAETGAANYINNGGNFGIGTTNPSTKLHVLSGTLNSSVATFSGANLDRGLKISTFNSGNNDGGVILDAQVALGVLTFATVGSEHMRIDASGNVGIGTTSPGSAFKLDVNGYIKANSRVYVRDSTKTVEIGTDYIQSYVTSGTGVNPIRFFTGSTEKARVNGNGNVGIGTTNPSQKLHVAGNIKATGWIGRDSSNYITFDETNNHIDFYAGGNWVARMESDGDLHVKGDVIAFSDIFNP